MKSVLIFDLEDEKMEYDDCMKGRDYYMVLWEMAQKLRNVCKHGQGSEDYQNAYQEMRDFFWQELNERGIDLYR